MGCWLTHGPDFPVFPGLKAPKLADPLVGSRDSGAGVTVAFTSLHCMSAHSDRSAARKAAKLFPTFDAIIARCCLVEGKRHCGIIVS